MLDLKAWIETSGLKAGEERFSTPPPLPYVLFNQEVSISGADSKNCIASRNITIELYSEKVDHEAESKIEALLNEKAINFIKNRTWIDSERFYQTVYDFNLLEKL